MVCLSGGLTILPDWPDVCDRARRDIEPELVGRLTYEPGDFVKSVPTGADLYIVKNVLHNWNDDSSIAILRTIATAMRSQTTARLLVIEPVVGGGMPGLFTALDNLVKVVIGERVFAFASGPAKLVERAR